MIAWLRSITRKHPLVTYFVLAYAFTWIGSLLYYFATPAGGRALPPSLGLPGTLVWYYGPALAATIVALCGEGKAGLRRLWGAYHIWRVGWKWYAFIVLYPLAMHLVVAGIAWLLGGPAPRFFVAEGVPKGNLLLVLVGLILWQTLLRGVGEETGWRGFALPRMQTRWTALTSSLLLGLLWAGWHFHPANFSALLSTAGVFLIANIVATTVIYTWVYNNTGGSLLIAALFHMTLNVSDWVVPIGLVHAGTTTTSLIIQAVVVWLVAAALVAKFGPGLKTRRTAGK